MSTPSTVRCGRLPTDIITDKVENTSSRYQSINVCWLWGHKYRDVVSDVRDTVSDIRDTVSDIRNAVSDVRDAVSDIRDTACNKKSKWNKIALLHCTVDSIRNGSSESVTRVTRGVMRSAEHVEPV